LSISQVVFSTPSVPIATYNNNTRIVGWGYIVEKEEFSVTCCMRDAFTWQKANHIVTRICNYRRSLDWWTDLLTTCTHGSKLQAVTSVT
jgi:hypothetical protein